MAKLLYIQASPRQRSKSTRVAQAFLDSYRENHPDDTISTLDIFSRDLPAFDGLAVQARYTVMHGQGPTAEEKDAWAAVEAVIDEFKEADKYLISVPMWNFGIPYRLKHYLDLLIQPSYTFTVSESGYQGLVTDRPVAVIYARGGAYPPGSDAAAFDLQKRYLDQALGFIGFEAVQSILVEPTLQGQPDEIETMIASQSEQAAQIAAKF